MRKYILIGNNKKPLNTNFKNKSPYIRNLYKKQNEILVKVKKEEAEIISEKILKNNYQRDYSFFAQNNPYGLIKEKKLPHIILSPQLKYTIVSPEEKYYIKKEKDDLFANIYKNKSNYFPRPIAKKKKQKSKSYIHLPFIH